MATTAMVGGESASGETTSSAYVILFELEGAAVNGHQKLFEACQAGFKKAGATLNELQFSRQCTHGAVPAIIAKLAAEYGNGQVSAEAEEAIFQDYVARLDREQVTVNPAFAEVLKVTRSRGIRAFALTILPEDTARSVLEKSGLAGQGIELHAFASNERHFPRVDCWMKICRQVAKSPRACIAVAGSRDSGKSALSSGMRCIVAPTSFTAYQDFGGVDAVLDSAEDIDMKELIASLT